MREEKGVPGAPPETGDMPAEEFREHARAVVEWMADYLRDVGEYPVLSRVRPGEVRGALPQQAPEVGEPFEAMMRDFTSIILPGITHWNHPGFHAYFANSASGPGILGEMLAAALNANAMVWRSSPAGTELETLTVDWVRDLVGLPVAFEGTINDTASHSTLYALAAAREKAYPGVRETGLAGLPRGRVYVSQEAHSSADKAAMTLGFGREGVRHVPVDAGLRMDAGALRRAIEADVAAGVRPVAVVATIGTTSTTAVDPVPEIAEICAEHDLWLHVDAAYAGPVAILPEAARHFAGWEHAGSVVINPHKWLFTPMDCSILYCRHPALLHRAFSLTPEYLRTGEAGEARNLMDSGVALGRRFRALKLWFVLRWFGAEGIRVRLREHIRLAQQMGEWMEARAPWELVVPVDFGTVVFRLAPEGVSGEETDALNEALLERVNASGGLFLSHTRTRGRIVLRLSVGNLRTTETHMARSWEILQSAAHDEMVARGVGEAAATV